ncbi:MAG: hypothetical protein LBJ72_07275 [Dysgonamonadaceae bacterium]|jgi:hypothetical protein|nr:hypothetical protein [Dysgonamonadaceae bacterium]
MKKKSLKIIAIFTLLLGVFYACHDLSDSILSEENQAQAVENAKLWYEDNKPEAISLKSTTGQEKY